MTRIQFATLAALVAIAPLSGALAEETTQPAAAPKGEHDQDKARAETREHVRTILKNQGKLSDKDLKDAEPDIKQFADRGGHGETVSDAVHAAQARGCTGQCLAAVVRDINRAMSHGSSEAAAAKAAAAAAEAARDAAARREESKENARAQAREHEREAATGAAGGSQTHGRH